MFRTSIRALVLIFSLSLIHIPASAATNDVIEEKPTMGSMVGDLLLRPVYLGVTAVSTSVFILGAPFSILGGNFGESFDVLVAQPFSTTFFRCLGCKDNTRSTKKAKQ